MKCPQCGHLEDKVLDTRIQREGDIRRRRECLNCKSRFVTLESLLIQYPYVLKKDKRREPFKKEKLRRGVQLACLKRPVSLDQVESIVQKISNTVRASHSKEVNSRWIGNMVMTELRSLDDVAYVRFASVYRTFTDVQEFVKSLDQNESGVSQ